MHAAADSCAVGRLSFLFFRLCCSDVGSFTLMQLFQKQDLMLLAACMLRMVNKLVTKIYFYTSYETASSEMNYYEHEQLFDMCILIQIT